MRRRRTTAALVALLVAALLGACVGLPEDGPVVEARLGTDRDLENASEIDARPPAPGASRVEIVNGFLEAMMAWPVNTSVAREYLSSAAAEEWRPRGTLVYSDLLPFAEDGSTVTVRLRDATRLDESGGWHGPAPLPLRSLDFRITVEDGEFRILDPIDTLVVRASWFQRRYRQVALYYFDSTGRVLVPEPVFVPAGDQLATSLVSALVAGPPDRLHDVVRTFVPPRLAVGLSVPVDDRGTATVDLQGAPGRVSEDAAELMLAQIAATLRQEPAIRSVRVTIGGEEVAGAGGAVEYDVVNAATYDVADTPSNGALYGLQRGRLVTGGLTAAQPVDGPLGRGPQDLASVAVSPSASRVAAVTTDGRVLLSALSAADDASVDTVMTGGTDLSRPAWDGLGRLWLLERGAPGGSQVLVMTPRGPREVPVPGVTGTAARRLLVSRDGSRLIALVAGATGDRLVASRVVLDDRGRVERGAQPAVIWSEPDTRVVDLAWTGQLEVAVLTPVRPGELFEVESVPVDGATVGVDTFSTVVSGRIVGLAGEPFVESPAYAIASDGLIEVRTGERLPFNGRVRELDYPG